MKKIFTLIFTLAMTASALWAQEDRFPHNVMDPLDIPPIPGAKCTFEEVVNEPPFGKIPYVYFDATPDQLRSWIKLIEKKGMLYHNFYKYTREQYLMRTEPIPGKIMYHFPLGSAGDKKSVYMFVNWNFEGTTIQEGGRKISFTTSFWLMPLERPKPELDYPAGILSEFGVTDESSFIPPNTVIFKTSVIRADKYIYDYLPAGTPVSGVLEANFCAGYKPSFAEERKWAKALYDACAANSAAIEPFSAVEEVSTCFWKYTYHGVQYQCHVSGDLLLMGNFSFTIRRRHKSEL